MRRAAKIDDNHREICACLRDIPGVSVADTSGAGAGFPDIVVGFRNQNWLIEIKDGAKCKSRRRLTPAQVKFHQNWTGQIAVCKNLDEILCLLKVSKVPA